MNIKIQECVNINNQEENLMHIDIVENMYNNVQEEKKKKNLSQI